MAEQPRAARPTLHDVASRAGVSVGTVSNVFNHPQKVAEPTRERVEAAVAELGFSRNGVAQALATGGSRTIGVVVPTFRNSLFVDVVTGAQRAAGDAGRRLQLSSSDTDPTLQDEHVGFMIGARVLGLLLAPMQDSRPEIELLHRTGTPVVLLNYVAERDVCTVLVDNEQVGRIAVEHVLGLGRRRIAFVGGRYDLQPTALRRSGARAVAMPAARFEEIEAPGVDQAAGAVAAAEILGRPAADRPDAVVAATDLLGTGIVDALMAAGVDVPGTVAVMGCDHDSMAWTGAVPLTSVTMEGEEMGREAVRLLLEELAGEPSHVHRTVVLEPHLVARESTVGRDRIRLALPRPA